MSAQSRCCKYFSSVIVYHSKGQRRKPFLAIQYFLFSLIVESIFLLLPQFPQAGIKECAFSLRHERDVANRPPVLWRNILITNNGESHQKCHHEQAEYSSDVFDLFFFFFSIIFHLHTIASHSGAHSGVHASEVVCCP